ncbi:MAG: hypothetical protein ACO2OV_05205 [Thermoproteota archaeon]
MKIIVFLLLLIITMTLINPINVKANSNDDIVYEVVKRNPDLVITGCNETYVYWQFNGKKFDSPVAIRHPGSNESTYINGIGGDYDTESFFIYAMLAAKYDLKYSIWYHYYQYLAEVRKEFYPLKEKLFAEKGDLGIRTLGIMDNYIPIVIVVTMYKITNEKVNIVLEYIKPFVKKYNALVFFIEDYRPDSLYERQDKALWKFYSKELPNGRIELGDGWKEYLKLVEEYYNLTMDIKGWGYSPGIAELPIPPNATFNKEFVEKAVSIVRKYAGCEVPLVVNFIDYKRGSYDLAIERSTELYYPSLLYIILIFVVIPIAILLPIILILRKVNNKKKKKILIN